MAPLALRDAWSAEQDRLAKMCVDTDQFDWCVHGELIEGLRLVAGVDVSFFPDGVHAVAGVVVLSFPNLSVVYERCATFKLRVPYMPGFLAFREVPALKAMLDKIPEGSRPQAVLVDGNGVFHPRRCGAATHLGIVTSLPTVGVAKDVLHVGDVNALVARQVAEKLQPGDWAPLVGNETTHGDHLAALLRPKIFKKTLVVSVGHRISLNSAIVLTAALCKESAIPEPIRQADLRSRAAVRGWFEWTPVPKLKLPREGGAGDLLKVALPNAEMQRNHTSEVLATEPATKRPRRVQREDEKRGVCQKSGRASKAKLAWRIKPVANESLAVASIQHPDRADAATANANQPGMAAPNTEVDDGIPSYADGRFVVAPKNGRDWSLWSSLVRPFSRMRLCVCVSAE